MDIPTCRRQHSTPLVNTGGETYGSSGAVPCPQGSPRGLGGRLPALWKSLKSKFGALGTSRSVNHLSSLATAGPDTRASPCASSPTQAVLPCRDRSPHGQCSGSNHLYIAGISQEGNLGRQAAASVTLASPQSAKDFGRGSSPPGLCTSPVATSMCAVIGANRASKLTTKATSAESVTPLPPATPNGDNTSYQPQIQGCARAVPEAAPTPNRKLLAVSPALPGIMRRNVWALEDYSVTNKLYKGSSSAVYRATCRRSGLPVALKVYFLSRTPSNVVHMLKREIEIHSQLVHRGIVRLHAAFLDEGDRVVLVQEYAAQGDLYGVLQRLGGRMPAQQVAEGVIRPSLEALSYMHSKGICHRDIKPENILFSQSWRLLVADFGVSINLNQERAVTRAGTEGYMAPEVERCPLKTEPLENKDDPRYAYSTAVDIWAVGVMAYELMVGFPPVVMSAPAGPFGASCAQPSCGMSLAADSLSGFVHSQMTAASLHFPASVPPAARSFVLAALAADPLERPTAAQLLRHPWMEQQQQQQQQQAQLPQAVAVACEVPMAAVKVTTYTASRPIAITSGPPPFAPCPTDEDTGAAKPSVVAVSPPPAGQPRPRGTGSRPACPALCTPA